MKPDLFKDRHPLLYAFLTHPWEAAGIAFILMVLLEIGTFSHLIVLKIRRLGNPDCSIGRSVKR
jgi:hypothetical protein